MKFAFLILLALCFFNIGASAEDLVDLSLEELLNVKVTTASKKEQTLAQATSVATVIMRSEIESSGVITLYDLLKRVPGFFPTHQATWDLLTTRGLPSDGNDHFLLLVDGHPQNSIIGQGYQQQDLIPALDKVEKIEITRGPGSVLWGSNAALSVINIITKDFLEKSKLTMEGQGGQQLQYMNYQAGVGDGKDIKGIYSLSVWGAKGYRYKEGNDTTVSYPWGSKASSATFGDWPYIDKQREGFELYSRVKFKEDTELYARILKTSFNYVWDEFQAPSDTVKHELGNRRAYAGLKKKISFNDKAQLDLNFYGDYNLQNRDPLQIYTSGYKTPNVQDQTNEEFAMGSEAVASLQLLPENSLKIGLKYVRTDIGPNRDARLNSITNTPVNSGTSSGVNYTLTYYGVDPGVDNSIAAYFEDSHTIGKANFFAGGRADWNDYREKGTKFLPRAGVVYSFSPETVAKYTFNTGYLRPNAVYAKTDGFIVDSNRGGAFPITRVTNSERVISHDFQFSHSTEKGFAALTLFYMQVKNFISFDATNVPQGYKNIGAANSKGAELEGKIKASNKIYLYGNASYAKGHIDDVTYIGALADNSGTTLNYPQFMSNLGLDWSVLAKHKLNLNGRLWTAMRYNKGQDEKPLASPGYAGNVFDTMGPRFYLDANYSIKDIFAPNMDLNIFCFNIFNNQDRVGMVTNNGTYRPLGRTIGARAAYSF